MSKRKKIMIIVGGVVAFIVLGIFIYLMNPKIRYYSDESCIDDFSNYGGVRIQADYKFYSIGFYQNHTGVHFLSKEK